jgi:hypothetical protein
MLEVVRDLSKQGSSFQTQTVLREVATRLGGSGDLPTQQAILEAWQNLFLSGQVAWGYNLANPEPPFCHLTDKGRTTLQYLSRDPSDQDGYLAYLHQKCAIDDIALSYIVEAVNTFNSNCFKACAVMTGAAAERLILCLRDSVLTRVGRMGETKPNGIEDWRIKTVRDALTAYLDQSKGAFPRQLSEMYSAYWSGFAEQIRRVRNDAGHPASVEPVSFDAVHAALLIFPELAALISQLDNWTKT